MREGKDKRFLMGANRSLFVKKVKIIRPGADLGVPPMLGLNYKANRTI